MFFGRSKEHQKFVAEVKLNWNLTEQSPQNQIGAPDQLHSELNLRPPDCNRTRPKALHKALHEALRMEALDEALYTEALYIHLLKGVVF